MHRVTRGRYVGGSGGRGTHNMQSIGHTHRVTRGIVLNNVTINRSGTSNAVTPLYTIGAARTLLRRPALAFAVQPPAFMDALSKLGRVLLSEARVSSRGRYVIM